MTLFRDFSAPFTKIFVGDLLMLGTCLSYISWWIITFRPNGNSKKPSAIIFLMFAIAFGVIAIICLISGIISLTKEGYGSSVSSILIGGTIFYIVSFVVTKLLFKRPVTSELLLINIWASIELLTIIVLQNSARFNVYQASFLIFLVIVATCMGIISYIIYYRLNDTLSFWDGLIPLIIDAIVVMVILAQLVLS